MSKGIFKVSLSQPLGGGVMVVKVNDPQTGVLRSARHLDGGGAGDVSGVLGPGGVGHPCPAMQNPTSSADIGFHPFGFNPNAGRDEVHTELRCMNLLENPAVPLNPNQWAVRAGTSALTPTCRSLGEVESRHCPPPCMNQGFPADSFFNLFLEIDPPDNHPFIPAGLLLRNLSPLTVEESCIRAFPPGGNAYLHSFQVRGKIPLFAQIMPRVINPPFICPGSIVNPGQFCFVGWLEQGSHGVAETSNECLENPVPGFALVFSVDDDAEGIAPDPICMLPLGVGAPNDVNALGPNNEGDVFQSSGATPGAGPDITNAQRISRANLGLLAGDDVDALSFGQDGGNVLLFSVDPASVGKANTAVNFHAQLSPPEGPITNVLPSNGGGDPGEESAGDLYLSARSTTGNFGGGMVLFGLPPAPAIGTNTLAFDELLLGLQAPATANSLGGPAEDDVDALEASDAELVDANGDGLIDAGMCVYFSLEAGSPSLGAGRTPDDILVRCGGGAITIFADGAAQLGLLATDRLDALALFDTGVIGVFGAGDQVLFSLAPGSGSLVNGANPNIQPNMPAADHSAADVFRRDFGAAMITKAATADQLGLLASDNLDALDVGWDELGMAPGFADEDGDGVGLTDNCKGCPNASQSDCDGDGVGNACDESPGVYDPSDNDADGDGRDDLCDNCRYTFNPTQDDSDGNGIGDVCEEFPFATGGCCVGGTCLDHDPMVAGIQNGTVVQCNADGGNYIGDGVACIFVCGNGACCLPDGTCENRTAGGAGGCNAAATNDNTYFGGFTCAQVTQCPPDNDKCTNAAILMDGTTPFTNVGAQTDGPIAVCSHAPATASPNLNDIWYNYVASCTGEVSISLCGPTPDYNSVVNVYTDTNCPIDETTQIACSDDNCGVQPIIGSWSELSFNATESVTYLVRVGSFAYNEEGSGVISVTCTPMMGSPCNVTADCRFDPLNNACNCATCTAGVCAFTCTVFGNTNCGGLGLVSLDDILCVLGGFASFTNCPNGDVNPCGGNGIINLDDVLSTLAAFSGANPCGCNQDGVSPLCGSISP